MRRFVGALAAGAVAVGLWTACSDYSDADAEIPPADAGSSVPDSATIPDGTTPPDKDADLVDADPGPHIDAAICTDPCDCDRDGYLAPSCADGGAADCDDSNPTVHPGQIYRDEEPLDSGAGNLLGDWNCDGKIEKVYLDNLDCATLTTAATCEGAKGFAGTVACGQKALLATCKATGLLGTLGTCGVASEDEEVEACR